jgi:small GTP-binding protein
MGGKISMLWNLFAAKRDVRVVVIGLDAAGKTTFNTRAKLGETHSTTPTLGFNVDTVEYKNLKMTLWDVGGQKRLRPLWNYYFNNCDAVIWVVDSADRERMKESLEELQHVLDNDLLRGATLLVYANKQDYPHALRPHEVADALKLNELCRQRKFWVQGSCFTNGNGLWEGLEWLSNNLPKKAQ